MTLMGTMVDAMYMSTNTRTRTYLQREGTNERTNERTKSRRSACLFVAGYGALADMSHVVFRMYLLNTQTNTHTQ